MIPSNTNSISWDQQMILSGQIPSPRITHTKVTIEPHFVLKSCKKGSEFSQKFLGARVMDVDCMLFEEKEPCVECFSVLTKFIKHYAPKTLQLSDFEP
jgi:hypothetical protein